DADIVADINDRHRNERRLPGVALAAGVRATTALPELAAAARLLVLAVGSPRVAATVRALADVVTGRHVITHAVGGHAPQAGRVSELIRTKTAVKRVGALAGPALARDLATGKPCAVVIASPFDEVAAEARAALDTPPTLRVYRSRDLLGVELASALTGAYT